MKGLSYCNVIILCEVHGPLNHGRFLSSVVASYTNRAHFLYNKVTKFYMVGKQDMNPTYFL